MVAALMGAPAGQGGPPVFRRGVPMDRNLQNIQQYPQLPPGGVQAPDAWGMTPEQGSSWSNRIQDMFPNRMRQLLPPVYAPRNQPMS